MFVFLSKFLPLLVYPLGLACIFIFLALFLARKPRWQKAILVLAFAVLWLGGNRWVAYGLMRSLEWRYLPPAEISSSQVIVVLGGGARSAQYPRPIVEFDEAGNRLVYASWLYQHGKADHILLSGGRIDWLSTGDPEAEDMAVLMEMMGVPRQALWLETASQNTYENALDSRAILEPKGIRQIILVTSAYHMPRSVAIFRRQGFEVIPAPVDYTVTQENWQRLTHPSLPSLPIYLLPNAKNLSLTYIALKEYLGMFIYRLQGWL